MNIKILTFFSVILILQSCSATQDNIGNPKTLMTTSKPKEVTSLLTPDKKRYFTKIHDILADNFEFNGTPSDQELVAIVLVNVNRYGQLENVEIERSSGNASFDAQAVSAVKQTKSFPPFPESITKEVLEIGLRFDNYNKK